MYQIYKDNYDFFNNKFCILLLFLTKRLPVIIFGTVIDGKKKRLYQKEINVNISQIKRKTVIRLIKRKKKPF